MSRSLFSSLSGMNLGVNLAHAGGELWGVDIVYRIMYDSDI